MAEREYKDSDGNVVTLDKLVRIEPEWAANIIRWYEGKLDEYEHRLDSAENAMREVVSHLQRSQRGSTHWAGCLDVHPVCQAIDMLVDALPSRDVEKLSPKSQSHGVNDVNLEPKMHDYPMAFQDMIAALMRHHTDEEIARMFANYADMGAQYGDPDKWAQRAAAWHGVNDVNLEPMMTPGNSIAETEHLVCRNVFVGEYWDTEELLMIVDKEALTKAGALKMGWSPLFAFHPDYEPAVNRIQPILDALEATFFPKE